LGTICGVLAGQVFAQQQKRSDSADRRKVADLFMGALVANGIDKASGVEPEFVNTTGGKQRAKTAVQQLFAYCGRPLDSEFKHEEQGFKQYLSGRRKETRKFLLCRIHEPVRQNHDPTRSAWKFAFSRSRLFPLMQAVTV